MTHTADIVIVGAGIVGLSIARELKQRSPDATILICEKEPSLGLHSSGRNSGVLHSGVYYPSGSLKARVCAEGGRELRAYCESHELPLRRAGKVILPLREGDDSQLATLVERAHTNGARATLIDAQQLKEIEPEAYSCTGQALHVPDTSVVDPRAVLEHIATSLRQSGVEIRLGAEVGAINPKQRRLTAGGETISYGTLINCAGLFADAVARAFDIGRKYTILPFKGIYYRLDEASGLRINGLIYPVPDLRVPFLGVHFTTKVDGSVYLGPTAVPAFGRENYAGLRGLSLTDTRQILWRLAQQYVVNHQGFRTLVHEEGVRYLKGPFAAAARALVPRLQTRHLLASDKVGIRAQLLDIERKELVMDFVVEQGEHSVHILNAISPAFTSAFSFARLVVDQFEAVSV